MNKGEYSPLSQILCLKIGCHGKVPWSVEQRKARFLTYDEIYPHGEIFVKSIPWILRKFIWNVYFKEINDGVETSELLDQNPSNSQEM